LALVERRFEPVDAAAWNSAPSPALAQWTEVRVQTVIADGVSETESYAQTVLDREVDPDVLHPRRELVGAARPTINALLRAAKSRLDRAQQAVVSIAKRIEKS
jgi:hypothetical protein